MKTEVYFSGAVMTNKKSFATSICHNMPIYYYPYPKWSTFGCSIVQLGSNFTHKYQIRLKILSRYEN